MNHGNQPSNFIARKPTLNFTDGFEHAWFIGRPLNWSVSLNLSLAEFGSRPQKFIGDYLKRIRTWLRDNCDEPLHFVWVLENPAGVLNAHLAVHVPSKLFMAFSDRRLHRRWIRGGGGIYRKGVLEMKPIRYPGEDCEEDHYEWWSTCPYFLKGAEPKVCEELGINQEYQGVIIGRRCSVSQTLNHAARAKHPKMAPFAVDPVLGLRPTPHLAVRWRPMSATERREYDALARTEDKWCLGIKGYRTTAAVRRRPRLRNVDP